MVLQSLQERREGALTRGRHVGHPEARTGRGENAMTQEGNSPAGAQQDSGSQTRARPGSRAAPITSAPRAH